MAIEPVPTSRDEGKHRSDSRVEGPLHKPAQHESGLRHTSGEAVYVDDLPHPPGTLFGFVLTSPHAHARIKRIDAAQARSFPGVTSIFLAKDIPGHNNVGPVVPDEELLASDEVHFHGQSVALIVGESYTACRKAAAAIEVEYEVLEPVFTIAEAIKQQSFLTRPHVIARGDVDKAIAAAPLRFSGEVVNGAQDHFYLETHVTLAVPEEGEGLKLYCSTQHPSEVQGIVAEVLHLGRHQITVEVPRMGGGFGGKETQAANFAAMASLAALRTKRPVKVWLNRDQDMAQTGKRHPFWTKFEAGFDDDGRILALKAELYSNGGFSLDLSRAILDRALFHADNCYFIPALRFEGTVCRTNLPSNTAFRGFGGPQGMLVVDEAINRAAERLKLDPAKIRELNFYGDAPRNETPYGQVLNRVRIGRMHKELMESSGYQARRAEIDAFNSKSQFVKRGIGYQPVKFGISFTTSFLNQAGALVLLYQDGTVQMNHGGTEMGQGLHTKMLAVCMHELGVSKDKIRAMNTVTDKVPNTSATAASSGSDLNGQAVKIACDALRERLRPIAAKLLSVDEGAAVDIVFAHDTVTHGQRSVPLAEVARSAYLQQIQLFATGYYRTPDIHYDASKGRGKPFHYYAYGTAVTEVEVNGLTGEHRIMRVDILHDVGASLVPSIDKGQVEGAFVQGVGWLTCEEVLFNDKGYLLTHSPDTYKIPAIGDVPEDFRVELLQNAPQDDVIHGSKAVGEPPFMLGISVVTALRHAIGGYGKPGVEVKLAIPCTPEAILLAVEDAKAGNA